MNRIFNLRRIFWTLLLTVLCYFLYMAKPIQYCKAKKKRKKKSDICKAKKKKKTNKKVSLDLKSLCKKTRKILGQEDCV